MTVAFDSRELAQWENAVNSIFGVSNCQRMREYCLVNNLVSFASDNVEWVVRLAAQAKITLPSDLVNSYGSIFSECIDSVTLFHAARPASIERYFDQGIRVSDSKDLNREAFEIFSPLGVSQQEIAAIALDKELGGEDGRVFLSIDDRDYTDECGHFLLYGSEYFGAIAARLTKTFGQRPRDLLHYIGIATVFKIDVPKQALGKHDFRNLAIALMAHYFSAARQNTEATLIDHTVVLYDDVPPDWIKGHYHPKIIKDPFRNFLTVVEDSTTCQFC